MEQSYDYREKKIVAVLSSKIEPGIAMNVLGHLAVALGVYLKDEVLGRPRLVDFSGVKHLGIAKYAFIITKSKQGKIREAIKVARENANIVMADYPEQMLHICHDDDLASELGKVEEISLNYLRAVFYGPREEVDRLTGRFSLWR